ncbi:MAG: O-antigen ligase family protein [Collinsella sp.]|nr:O-antigen ligase family protein [Collinsella sp.]
MFFVLLFLITNLKGREYKHPSALFCIMVVISSIAGYLAGYVDSSNCTDALLYAICLYALALLITTCSRRGRLETFMSVFFWMTVIYCVLSIVFIARVGTADGPLLYYFAGNKFSTSYYFIMLACLAYAKLRREGRSKDLVVLVTAGLGLLALVVAHAVYCSTAVAMSALLIALVILPRKAQRILEKPAVVIAAMVLTGVILAFLLQLLQVPFVKHIVVDVLGENLTLTGRDLIYSGLRAVISESPIFGYGYGNAAVAMYVGYGNAQNSIMETLVNYGVVGLFAVFYMAWTSVKGDKPSWSWGMYIMLYAMIAGSIVEITYNYYFFIALMAIFVASEDIQSRGIEKDEKQSVCYVNGALTRR